MAAEQRKLLEQLMGQEMMHGMSARPQATITDIKIHNQTLKDEYEAGDEAQKKRWGFDFDYLREMGKYIDDCNRKIESAQKRLDKTPEEIKATHTMLKRISELTETISIGLAEVEMLATLGHVNLAVSEHFKVRQAQQQKDEVERELKMLSDTQGPSGHQKLQVCDVCGAYLSRLDNDRRLADHFYGKMHLGYAQMRRTHETLSAELKGRQPPQRPDDRGYGQENDHGRQYGRYNGYGGRGGGGRGRGRRGY